MFPIASYVPSGGAGSYVFTNIPQTYTHLQLRIFTRSAATISNTNTRMWFNGDTGSNYTLHRLYGNGATATSAAATPFTDGIPSWETTPGASLTSGIFGVAITDILDYTNTSKYKTYKSLSGYDANGSGITSLTSGVWMSTAAISSITFAVDGNFAAGSRIDLYGLQTSSVTGA